MEFNVKLIKIPDKITYQKAAFLTKNCTHITGRLWMFEGDDDWAERFQICSGVTEGVGDMSGREMFENALEVFFRKEELLWEEAEAAEEWWLHYIQKPAHLTTV